VDHINNTINKHRENKTQGKQKTNPTNTPLINPPQPINSSISFPYPFTDLVRGFIQVVISRLDKPLAVGLVLLVAG
jgi:hypothetical protein